MARAHLRLQHLLNQVQCSATDSPVTVGTHRTKLNDGKEIPTIGFGVYLTKTGDETYNSVMGALKAGYRHIDTAEMYYNEADVGRAIRDSGIPRDQIWITSKLWPPNIKKEGYTDGYVGAMDHIKKSMELLGTHCDLYLVHAPYNPEQRIGYWLALEEAQRQGLVGSIGVSNFGVHHLKELLEHPKTSVVPAVNQIELHPFLHQAEIVQFCASKGIRMEAYSPLARAQRMDNQLLLTVAKAHNVSPAQVMVRWGIQRGHVCLPKSTNPQRTAQNGDVFKFELSASEMQQINALNENLVTELQEWGGSLATTWP